MPPQSKHTSCLILSTRVSSIRNPILNATTLVKLYSQVDQRPFSDMYECRTWGLSRNVVTFTLTVQGVPNIGDITDLVSPHGKIGRVEDIDKQEELNVRSCKVNYQMYLYIIELNFNGHICTYKTLKGNGTTLMQITLIQVYTNENHS